MRNDLFVYVSEVACCSLRVEVDTECRGAACLAFSLKLFIGLLCLLLRSLLSLPPLGCLVFDCCCSFWFLVAILNILSLRHLKFVSCLLDFFRVLLVESISALGLLGALFGLASVGMRDGPGTSWFVVVVE